MAEYPRIHQLVDRWGQGLDEVRARIDSGNAGLPNTGWGRWDTVIIEVAPTCGASMQARQFAFVDPEFSQIAGFTISRNENCTMRVEEIAVWLMDCPEAMAHHAAQMVYMRRINAAGSEWEEEKARKANLEQAEKEGHLDDCPKWVGEEICTCTHLKEN